MGGRESVRLAKQSNSLRRKVIFNPEYNVHMWSYAGIAIAE